MKRGEDFWLTVTMTVVGVVMALAMVRLLFD
jgi:hypothetical protein